MLLPSRASVHHQPLVHPQLAGVPLDRLHRSNLVGALGLRMLPRALGPLRRFSLALHRPSLLRPRPQRSSSALARLPPQLQQPQLSLSAPRNHRRRAPAQLLQEQLLLRLLLASRLPRLQHHSLRSRSEHRRAVAVEDLELKRQEASARPHLVSAPTPLRLLGRQLHQGSARVRVVASVEAHLQRKGSEQLLQLLPVDLVRAVDSELPADSEHRLRAVDSEHPPRTLDSEEPHRQRLAPSQRLANRNQPQLAASEQHPLRSERSQRPPSDRLH